jgi:hypothetical protein
MNWIFSAQNPTYSYLNMELAYNSIPSSVFSTAASSSSKSVVSVLPTGFSTQSIESILSAARPLGLKRLFTPWVIPQDAHNIINSVSQFLFIAIILFALNVAITIAFAQSLTRALNSGIEGSNPFWGTL